MPDAPRFRPERGPSRGAPWSLVGLLALVTVGLVVRASWTNGAPAPLIEVRGEVPRPGTYPVPAGTVRAAIEAAGGQGSAFPDTPVPHGFRVQVEGGSATVQRPSDPVLVALPVDPNTAERHELLALPGVGPATAERILDDRERHGPYRDLASLRRVLRADTLTAIEPFLALSKVPPVDLNRAGAGELETLPGIGPVLAARIVVDRDENGSYAAVDDLARVRGLSGDVIEALRPLVQVGP
jgi:DNA uptake protein ComE-like DNA-binding protein